MCRGYTLAGQFGTCLTGELRAPLNVRKRNAGTARPVLGNPIAVQPLSRLHQFWGSDMRASLLIGMASLVIVGMAPQAPAQKLKDVLGSIIYPNDARRYEEQAHQHGRPDEEHYWHDYGEGLQKQNYPADARQHEEEARRNGQPAQERYWRNYGEGLRQQGYR